jgi:hypothetical protein
MSKIRRLEPARSVLESHIDHARGLHVGLVMNGDARPELFGRLAQLFTTDIGNEHIVCAFESVGEGLIDCLLRRVACHWFDSPISRFHIVVETQHQVSAALAAGLDDIADFSTEIPDQDFDVVITSGALQYLENPIGRLRKLVALKAPTLVLARNLFSSIDLFIEQKTTLFNHLPGPLPPGFADRIVRHYPQTVNIDDARAVLAEAGYIIRATVPDESGYPIRHPSLVGENWLCVRQLV